MAVTPPPTPDELLLLDIDYSVPLMWCKSPHPVEPVHICSRLTGHGIDEYHATRNGNELVKWKDTRPSSKSRLNTQVETKIEPVISRGKLRPSES